jgi:hypothetical protein
VPAKGQSGIVLARSKLTGYIGPAIVLPPKRKLVGSQQDGGDFGPIKEISA